MRTSLALPSLSVLLLTAACSGAPEAEPAETTSAAYTDYDARMGQACLRALPEGPAFEGAFRRGELEGAPLGPAAMATLADRPELARGFVEVFRVHCSTRGYGTETPACARIHRDEEIDRNLSPQHVIERGESYRHVVLRVDTASGAPALRVDSAVPEGTWHRPDFMVTGSPDALRVTMRAPAGRLLAEELRRIAGTPGTELALDGRMVDGELLVTATAGPTVVWNTVSCARAVLRTSFEPVGAAPAQD